MEKNILIKIGLTRIESEIYLALLSLGPSLVGEIVKKTKNNRTNTYDRLEKLIDKGLVSYVIKNNRKYFQAAKPKRILRYLEEKEEKIEKEKEIVEKILPKLEMINPVSNKDNIEVYEGKEGLKTILEDIISTKENIYTYGSDGNFTKILRFYFNHYLKKLEKTKIKMKVIFNEDDVKKPFNWKFAEVRYLPKEFKSPTETTIFSNKVAIFILTNDPKAILIESNSVSNSYKKYFELLWKMAKKTK